MIFKKRKNIYLLWMSIIVIAVIATLYSTITYGYSSKASIFDKADVSFVERVETGDFEAINGEVKFKLSDVSKYTDKPYAVVNDNNPYFTDDDLIIKSYEYYCPLDDLDRCTEAYACIGKEMLPDDPRESLGGLKPTGWHTIRYDIIEGEYLYNRCHLIGYQLTGQNRNKQNLITGTRYMNVEGMLPFEDMVAAYIEETGNHVLYRVTPIFKDDELLARGVLMEAKSVEDIGSGICFNVFVYNVQPGIDINYSNGESSLSLR